MFGRPDSARVRSAVEKLLTYEVSVLPLDSDCAEEFGRLRVNLRRKGLNVDNMDLLIAATALVYDLTLVTHNTTHFRNIPSLRLEDWIAS